MNDSYITYFLKQRIEEVLKLPGTYVKQVPCDNPSVRGYRLMKGNKPAIELFSCFEEEKNDRSIYSVEYSIYTLKVNGIVMAQRPFSKREYDLSHAYTYEELRSYAGNDLHSMFHRLRDRYEREQGTKRSKKELASIPQQKTAYDFLGKIINNSKQY